MKEYRFLHTARHLDWWGDQPGQKGSSEALEKTVAASLRRAKQRENGQCHPLAYPSLIHSSPGGGRVWVLRLKLWRED